MIEDAQLLQQYTANRSGEAFAELVRRHLPFVYAASLRQLDGAVHRAEDVTQTVFIELARNARSLSRRAEIVGWLYTATHHTAAKLKRSEQRRQTREQEALLMQSDVFPSPAIDWDQVRPVIDAALLELNDGEREVILMRFFQAQRFADVGRKLGLTEDAARMRVERALDKLRQGLARREITSTTAALAVVLASQPAVAVPATLAATVTEAALAGGATAAAAGGWAALFNLTHLQIGASGVLAFAAVTGLVLQARSNTQLRAERDGLHQETVARAQLRAENLRLVRTAAEWGEMRGDDAELARLQEESATLQARLQQVVRTEEARAARVRAAASEPDRSRLDRLPKPRLQLRPQYPVELRALGVGGEVLVEFIVDSNGDVRDVRTRRAADRGDPPGREEDARESVRLAPFTVAATPMTDAERALAGSGAAAADPGALRAGPLLEAAAMAAVSQWKFEAGNKGGRAVATRLSVPVVFVVADWKVQPEAPGIAGPQR